MHHARIIYSSIIQCLVTNAQHPLHSTHCTARIHTCASLSWQVCGVGCCILAFVVASFMWWWVVSCCLVHVDVCRWLFGCWLFGCWLFGSCGLPFVWCMWWWALDVALIHVACDAYGGRLWPLHVSSFMSHNCTGTEPRIEIYYPPREHVFQHDEGTLPDPSLPHPLRHTTPCELSHPPVAWVHAPPRRVSTAYQSVYISLSLHTYVSISIYIMRIYIYIFTYIHTYCIRGIPIYMKV